MFPRLVQAKAWSALLIAALLMSVTAGVALADPGIDPCSVERLIFPGESTDVAKAVTTPEIPPLVDICLLEDGPAPSRMTSATYMPQPPTCTTPSC